MAYLRGIIALVFLFGVLFGIFSIANFCEERSKEKEAAHLKQRIQDSFFNNIEKHYQTLLTAYNNNNLKQVSNELRLFRRYKKPDYKDVADISRKVRIATLEEEVRPSASQAQWNLRIYKKLLALDPKNLKYKRKVTYYKQKAKEIVEAKARKKTKEMSVSTSSNLSAEEQVKEYLEIAPPAPRVLAEPLEGNMLGRIQPGKKVEILEKRVMRSGRLYSTWYRIKYKGWNGWISHYVTTGEIIREEVGGRKKIVKAPYSDYPKIAKYDKKGKEIFKKWALETTAITWLEYQDDGIIWARLSPEKYTTKSNVAAIAKHIAKAYRMQTNYNKLIVVRILDPYESKTWAEESLL